MLGQELEYHKEKNNEYDLFFWGRILYLYIFNIFELKKTRIYVRILKSRGVLIL